MDNSLELSSNTAFKPSHFTLKQVKLSHTGHYKTITADFHILYNLMFAIPFFA